MTRVGLAGGVEATCFADRAAKGATKFLKVSPPGVHR